MAIHHLLGSNDLSLSSNPLFSSFVALYLLILLYFPHFFFTLSLSPLFISSQLLLFLLFKLGLSPQSRVESQSQPNPVCCDPNPRRRKILADWDVGAPLEVIYEAFEGEEERDEDQYDAFKPNSALRIRRYPSLSRYYPESDSDSESESDSGSDSFPCGLQWDDGEERDGMIEIDLRHEHDRDDHKRIRKVFELSHVDEEDNLIEIDISLTKTNHGFYW